MKMINYSFNIENVVKNEALFVQSLNEYFWQKLIVYKAKKIVFGYYSSQFNMKWTE
jgi:hypothetical protein